MSIILTILVFVVGLFLGISAGVHAVTEHLIRNNRLTVIEANYYYSLRNLIKLWIDAEAV